MTSHYNQDENFIALECDCCARIADLFGDGLPIGWTRYTTRKSIIDVCPKCRENMPDDRLERLGNPFSEPIVITQVRESMEWKPKNNGDAEYSAVSGKTVSKVLFDDESDYIGLTE